MTTDNRTNEPTPEQVEAAAKALRADEGFMEGVHSALEVSWSEYIARLVLVAAQGAAPSVNDLDTTAEPVKTGADSLHVTPQAAKDIHEPSHDRVYCVRCGGNWPCQPAPVLPSSGVDEDALAEVILAAEYAHRDAEFRGVRDIGTLAHYQARAVAEWLKGQGR